MNFGAVTSEITFLICVVLCGYYGLHSSRWHFQTHWMIEVTIGAWQAEIGAYLITTAYIALVAYSAFTLGRKSLNASSDLSAHMCPSVKALGLTYADKVCVSGIVPVRA